jgi:hypothetical protein
MKMARASEADMEAAFKVAQILDQLDKRYMPSYDDSEELEFFDRNDAEQCQKVIGLLLDATARTSLFRVVWGMDVVLDPANELLDPDADTIEKHPKIVSALEAMAAKEVSNEDKPVCDELLASYMCSDEQATMSLERLKTYQWRDTGPLETGEIGE